MPRPPYPLGPWRMIRSERLAMYARCMPFRVSRRLGALHFRACHTRLSQDSGECLHIGAAFLPRVTPGKKKSEGQLPLRTTALQFAPGSEPVWTPVTLMRMHGSKAEAASSTRADQVEAHKVPVGLVATLAASSAMTSLILCPYMFNRQTSSSVFSHFIDNFSFASCLDVDLVCSSHCSRQPVVEQKMSWSVGCQKSLSKGYHSFPCYVPTG